VLLLLVILIPFLMGLLISQWRESKVLSALAVWFTYLLISFFLQVFLIPGPLITNILTGLGMAALFFAGAFVIKAVRNVKQNKPLN